MQILIVTPEAARWTAFGEGLRAAGLSCSFAGAPDDLKAESLKADRPLLVLWDEPYTGDALRAAGIGVIRNISLLHMLSPDSSSLPAHPLGHPASESLSAQISRHPQKAPLK